MKREANEEEGHATGTETHVPRWLANFQDSRNSNTQRPYVGPAPGQQLISMKPLIVRVTDGKRRKASGQAQWARKNPSRVPTHIMCVCASKDPSAAVVLWPNMYLFPNIL